MLYPECDWQCASCYESTTDWSAGDLKDVLDDSDVDADEIVAELERHEFYSEMREKLRREGSNVLLIDHAAMMGDAARGHDD
ncbi:hypothetical protein AUR64_17320 [Haloprofundus marisrubri]|uniref:Uncharacterized protein n=1 Tax=Haloprofundus marisrubri TaxID=1514971 RepID=A0A0W1R8Z2_9EURY|nr:hypothetical protein [Haloprofundus marisrubri]KTG09527.1 hypothetical protein AUR64_17320 [Haloprofundus marisrubri]